MPIFEYECNKCGRFDVLQLAGEKALRFCPTCAKKKKKSKVEKVVSASSFHLKGTGWYKTDYATAKPATDKVSKKKNSNAETAEQSPSSGSAEASSSDTTKADSVENKVKNTSSDSRKSNKSNAGKVSGKQAA
jgi:putative FmdB family regulatory protein